MKVKKSPETQLLGKGKIFKNLKMLAEANTIGPKHLSVEESVLVILKGKVVLKIKDEEYTLRAGETKIIPGGIEHYLEIIEDTEAIHIMPLNNKIKLSAE
jgi:quercetin dioxygenase-like cupin family protein